MSPAYEVHRIRAVHDDPRLLPNRGGLYAVMLPDREVLEPALQRAGLRLDVVGLGQDPILYLGATADSLRRRVMCHLGDDSARSTFRMSLGVILQDDLQLKARPTGRTGAFGFEPACEARLTDWICAHLTLAHRVAERPAMEEHRLISDKAPLLNINGRRRSQSAWTLLTLRRRCQFGTAA